MCRRTYREPVVTLRPATELLCLGELLVDMVPGTPAAGLAEADTFVRAAGGAPANVAVAASRLGAGAAVAAAVGDDPFGASLERVLREAGVDTTFVRRVQRQTAVAFVGLGDQGEGDFMFYGDDPAHDHLTQEHAVEAVSELVATTGTRALHFGSVCLAREPARSATAAAIEVAARGGCLISCDVNLRTSFWSDLETARRVVREFLSSADVVKLSAAEAAFLAGHGSEQGARVADELLTGGASLVLISRGAAGAEAHTRNFVVSAPSPRVRAIDTTGAGDALCGAVLAATLADPAVWADERSATLALEQACAYAALSTTRRGGIPSYASAAALQSFLAGGTGA